MQKIAHMKMSRKPVFMSFKTLRGKKQSKSDHVIVIIIIPIVELFFEPTKAVKRNNYIQLEYFSSLLFISIHWSFVSERNRACFIEAYYEMPWYIPCSDLMKRFRRDTLKSDDYILSLSENFYIKTEFNYFVT